MTENETPPRPGRRKLLVDTLTLLSLLALGGAAYLLAPSPTPRSDLTLPVSDCDLGKSPCLIALPDGGQVEVLIDPRPIRALKPLTILATVHDADVRKMEVDLAGEDMAMGFNRPLLEKQGNGRFAGQASLPICVTGRMSWKATVLIDTGRSVVAAPFRFEVEGR